MGGNYFFFNKKDKVSLIPLRHLNQVFHSSPDLQVGVSEYNKDGFSQNVRDGFSYLNDLTEKSLNEPL